MTSSSIPELVRQLEQATQPDLQHKLTELVRQLEQATQPYLQHKLTKELHDLVAGQSDAHAQAAANAVPCLVGLLGSSSNDVRRQAAETLSTLACQHSTACQVAGYADAIPALARLLARDGAGHHAAKALRGLAAATRSMDDALVATHLAQIVEMILEHSAFQSRIVAELLDVVKTRLGPPEFEAEIKKNLSYVPVFATLVCSVSFVAMLAPLPSSGSWARPAFLFCNAASFSLALLLVMVGVMTIPEAGKGVLIGRWRSVSNVFCLTGLALVLAFLAAAYDHASTGQWVGLVAMGLVAIPTVILGGYAALLLYSPAWLANLGLA